MTDNGDRLLALRDRLERKVKKLRENLDRSEKDLEHVSRSVELLGRNGKSPKQEDLGIVPDAFVGKGLCQALVMIAKQNNNILKSTPARSLLIEAGLLNPKTSSSVMNTTLKRANYFKRCSRGVYEYIPTASPSGNRLSYQV